MIDIANDVLDRELAGSVTIVIAASEPEPVRVQVEKRWRELLAAFSSGIAHVDTPDDPRLPGWESKLAAVRHYRFEFITFDDPVPTDATLVYAIGEPPPNWSVPAIRA
ncbi:MAG TPA: hypothetical protein VGC41_26825 [Kofleriaceae bacterium]